MPVKALASLGALFSNQIQTALHVLIFPRMAVPGVVVAKSFVQLVEVDDG